MEESGHAFVLLFSVVSGLELKEFFLLVVEFSSDVRLQVQKLRLCQFLALRKLFESLLDVGFSVLTVLEQHLTEFIVSFLNVWMNYLVVLCF